MNNYFNEQRKITQQQMEQQNQLLQRLKSIYQKFIEPSHFVQIEHVPDQFISCQIALQEQCLCLTHSFFNKYYPFLSKQLTTISYQQSNWICQLLLVMNGQNDKAWNLKKQLLKQNKLDLNRQLKFNAAVCYKNKKSSSYYDYRLKIFQQIIKQSDALHLIQIYQLQTALVSKILGRFFRNYYCWMYRNRLFNILLPICKQPIIQFQINSLHKFIELNPNDYSAYSRLIPVVIRNKVDINIQILWLTQLEEFCSVAFSNKDSFKHIQTYRKVLRESTKNP